MKKKIKTKEEWSDQFDDNEVKIKLPKLNWKPGRGPLDWLVRKFKKKDKH